MFCVKCGTNVTEGDKFCPECGSPCGQTEMPVIEVDEYEGEGRRKKSPVRLILAVALCIVSVAAVIFGGYQIYRHVQKGNESASEEYDAVEEVRQAVEEKKQQEEETPGEDPEKEASEVEVSEKEETDDWLEQFGIIEEAVTDYGKIVDKTTYRTYNGGNGFSFGYAPDLYNQVSVYTEEAGSDMGTLEQGIRFTASDAVSELEYKRYRRSDSAGIEDKVNDLYQMEMNRLYAGEAIVDRKVESSYGRFIITGYDDREETAAVYYVVYVDKEYVMTMKVMYPDNGDKEGTSQRWYYVETLYRMCGFSGSTHEPRTYEQYLNDV